LAVALLAGGSAVAAAGPCPKEPCPPDPSDPPETYGEGGGILGSIELSSVIKVSSGAESPDVSNVNLVSAHLSLSHGFPHVRYFASLDLAIGATLADDGFAVDLQLLPIGGALQLRRPENTAFIGVATGIGVSAAPPALRTVGMIPLQLQSVVAVSEKLNVIARARVAWFLNKTSRDDGAPSVSFVDELDAVVALQFSRFHNYLEGRYVGAAYRELDGARFIGIVVGSGGGEEVFLGNPRDPSAR
jgi:hypothetical protein